MTMKNVSNKNTWNLGMMQDHVKPPPIPPIKRNNYDKSDKYFVKLKLSRDPTSAMSDLYEFKMDLFENDDLEELFLFVQN